jgi:hypothetical protein
MSPVVRGQRQADIVYIGLSHAFVLVPHNLLLLKFCSFGFSDGYFSWYRSYLTYRNLWSAFLVLSDQYFL